MTILLQQISTGIITGSLYALLGLAFVLIFRTTGVINFSQGEMATLTTFIGWMILQHVPWLVAFVLTIVVGFTIGAVTERIAIRPALGQLDVHVLTIVIGLFLLFAGLTTGFFGADLRPFPAPIRGAPFDIGGVLIPRYNLFVFGVAIFLMLVLLLFFRFTSLGLALRATASNRPVAELMGLRTAPLLMAGWGFAGAMGGAAGFLLAPTVTLTNEMMILVIVSALSAVLIGGLTSPLGALVGGLIIGVSQNLVGTYIDDVFRWFSLPDVKDPNGYREIGSVLLLLTLLVFRPAGLFGRRESEMQRA